MPISQAMKKAISGGSTVRRMFEEGVKLKREHGPDKVFDFSLGNPDLPPPERFIEVATSILQENLPGTHAYMSNFGWSDVREKLATYLDKTIGLGLKKPIKPEHVLMTVGAAGGMNTVFKSILEPGDTVIALAPYFMEYNYYVSNHGGQVIAAQTDDDFRPDVFQIIDKIKRNTAAVIINSPNNPTGAVYTAKELASIGQILSAQSKRIGRPIILVSDEPYRKIVFNDQPVPSVFQAYPYSVVVSSFSKDLSIPGERIGYAVVNPLMPDGPQMMEAMVLANRILGFVNAPSLAQKTVAELLEDTSDLSVYERRQELMFKELTKIGYKLVKPEGTFYLFPKCPNTDEETFVNILRERLILAVPGSGFGRPGHFRLSLCLSEDMIKASLPGFADAFASSLR
jgi:aspartate aminotransferase